MEVVEPFETEGCVKVIIAEHQHEYAPIHALVYPDGVVLIEWAFTTEEREAIARGENLRHWIWRTLRCRKCGEPHYFEPLKLEVTAQRHG